MFFAFGATGSDKVALGKAGKLRRHAKLTCPCFDHRDVRAGSCSGSGFVLSA